ncbi:phosphoribosyltransferase-like protein [Streptomyces achromogenes]
MGQSRNAIVAQSPSSTPEGKSWIQNFPAEDRETAELLINSLRIFSADDFRSRLLKMILDRLAEVRGPVAVYPVKNTRKNEQEPLPFPAYRKLPGSYAIVANIIRDAVENPPKGVAASGAPELCELRDGKFRSVLLIDDYAGSGGLAVRHGKGWMRNTTIRSWRSYGLLEIHYASFAVSSLADRNIKKERLFDSVSFLEYGVDFASARWTSRERESIEDLCRAYAWKKEYAYGRDKSRGLCVMPHTVPNNLPAVLWQKKGPSGGPWEPLFRTRRMNPRQQIELAGYGRRIEIEEISAEIGQRRLARQLDSRLRDESPELKKLLVLLGALAARKRRDHTLSVHFGVPVGVIAQMLSVGRTLGLIDEERRLTDAGWAELRSARRATKQLPTPELTGSDEPYYPMKLRGSQ